MNGYDFELDLELRDGNNVFDWNPRMTMVSPPPKTLLVPVGMYDGGDLLPGHYILDSSYVVYMGVSNLECDCEVM